jgi:phosphoribosyl-ATP pyrophosphohydrolase/phosphoribosyl-AMP cyclohydrolase
MQVDAKAREEILNTIKFDKDPSGLVPAVIQDPVTKNVLMMGFVNSEALEKTLNTGLVTFWTRSRQKLWTKGETSGNTLNVVSIRVNCNEDSLLIMATPAGPTCHTGHPTCYYREAGAPDQTDHYETWRTITEAQFDPDEVYKK